MAAKSSSSPDFVNAVERSPLGQRIPFQMEQKIGSNLSSAIKIFFAVPTILSMGAIAQIALILTLPTRLAVLPALVYLFGRLLDTSMQAAGVLSNRYMADVVPGRVSAQFPSTATGKFGSTIAGQPVVVFMLGMRINHPLGPLAPGVARINAEFVAMTKELCERTDEYGCIGVSSWEGHERVTSNELLTLFYFRDVVGLNKFAHSEMHRKGWNWFNKANHTHIAIVHEVFSVPAGAYDSVYINSGPTHMGAASIKVHNEDSDEQEWVRPLVHANKGPLQNQFGRLAGQIVQGQDKHVENTKEEPEWSSQVY